MELDREPANMGKCHICGEHVPIKFCPRCGHWFCTTCRKNWFLRGYEAVMEKVNGKQPGCCGPMEG